MIKSAGTWAAAPCTASLALVLAQISVSVGCGACAPSRSRSVPDPLPGERGKPSGPLEPPSTGQPETSTAPSTTEAQITAREWPAVPGGFTELSLDSYGSPATQQTVTSAAAEQAAIRFFTRKQPDAPTPQFVAVAALDRVTLEVRFSAGQSTSRITQNCRHGINGGYFTGSSSLSIVKSKGILHSSDAQELKRPQGKAEPTRGALLWDPPRRRAHFTWASVVNGGIQSFSQPADPYRDKRKGGAAAPVHSDALGAGPLLLKGSQNVLNPEREAFDEGIMPRSAAPRSAVGVTTTGYLVTMVADGRTSAAPGMTLQQLAESLKEWGVTDGLNLDGGGSSTFVVSGRVVNRPSDGKERTVTSALCLLEN